jgi:hypothetical protein
LIEVHGRSFSNKKYIMDNSSDGSVTHAERIGRVIIVIAGFIALLFSITGFVLLHRNDWVINNDNGMCDGSTGATGRAGSAGNNGSAGSAGIYGATGVAGVDGNDGTDGVNGIEGSTGVSGASGASGIIGATGIPGTGVGIPGVTGPTGIDGSDGDIGVTGTTGPAGTDGTDGTNGTDGTDGTDGTNGTNGVTGVTGVMGPVGDIGATGVPGIGIGIPGVTGMTGHAGTDGSDGADGTDGVDGNNGAIGVTGTTGPAGTTGPTGTNGTDGADGTDGTNGIDGAIGVTGTTGPAGTNGTVGTDGDIGVTGTTGPADTLCLGESRSHRDRSTRVFGFAEQSTFYVDVGHTVELGCIIIKMDVIVTGQRVRIVVDTTDFNQARVIVKSYECNNVTYQVYGKSHKIPLPPENADDEVIVYVGRVPSDMSSITVPIVYIGDDPDVINNHRSTLSCVKPLSTAVIILKAVYAGTINVTTHMRDRTHWCFRVGPYACGLEVEPRPMLATRNTLYMEYMVDGSSTIHKRTRGYGRFVDLQPDRHDYDLTFLVRARNEGENIYKCIQMAYTMCRNVISHKFVVILHLCTDKTATEVERFVADHPEANVETHVCSTTLSLPGTQCYVTENGHQHTLDAYYNWSLQFIDTPWLFKLDADLLFNPSTVQYLRNVVLPGPTTVRYAIRTCYRDGTAGAKEEWLFHCGNLLAVVKYVLWEVNMFAKGTLRVDAPDHVTITHNEMPGDKNKVFLDRPAWYTNGRQSWLERRHDHVDNVWLKKHDTGAGYARLFSDRCTPIFEKLKTRKIHDLDRELIRGIGCGITVTVLHKNVAMIDNALRLFLRYNRCKVALIKIGVPNDTLAGAIDNIRDMCPCRVQVVNVDVDKMCFAQQLDAIHASINTEFVFHIVPEEAESVFTSDRYVITKSVRALFWTGENGNDQISTVRVTNNCRVNHSVVAPHDTYLVTDTAQHHHFRTGLMRTSIIHNLQQRALLTEMDVDRYYTDELNYKTCVFA